MNRKEKCYRFAALADIHIDLENGGKNIYFIHAEENFSRALEVIKELGCDFVVSVGDQVTNASGAKEEWQRYQQLIERSGYEGRFFEAMGNHETRFAACGGCTIEDCREEFITYTHLSQKPVERPRGKTYYAYCDETFGDAFVFLSLENGVDVNQIDNFSDEQMDWAERVTEQYRRQGRRIFLIQHAPFSRFGAGDDVTAPAYEGSIRLNDKDGRPFFNNRRFFDLIHRDKDMIWLSGHTHLDFRDNCNISSDGGNACHMLHIPALAGTARLSGSPDQPVLDRAFYRDAIQGYIADVYEDRVVFRGIDFMTKHFYEEYTYTIAQ